MNGGLHFGLPGYGMHGLGASAAQLGVQTGATVAGAFSPVIASSTGLTTALTGTAFAGMAVPIVGAAIAGIAIAIEAILNSGCGPTCVETSQWANAAEPLLQQNVEAYFAVPAPRPASVQQAALQNFDSVWSRLVQLCSQPGLGTAGQNCIGDRQSGACKWKASATGAYPGQPAQGQCWNWFNSYRDPIANDTQVDNSIGGIIGLTGSSSDLLWIGAAVVGGLFLVSQL